MIFVDPQSFAMGVLTGVAGAGIFIGFAAALVTFAGADSDKRGLSGRHRPARAGANLLSGPVFPALPVSAPRKRSRPRTGTPSGVLPRT